VFELVGACSTTHNRKQHNTPNQTYMHIERTYVFNNIRNNRRQQFPHPIILTPDDDHITQNM
jgi:hypothetical protein